MKSVVLPVSLAALVLLACSTALFAEDHQSHNDTERQRIERGFKISPVTLHFNRRNWEVVGLGSYLVNAVGGCNDCHSNPAYADGGDPHLGQPEKANTANFLAGAAFFGPFVSRNITPDADTGLPAGLTFRQFKKELRTGVDLKALNPEISPLLQVMPWPVYGKMGDRDLQAIYEYLKAIPHAAPAAPAAAARQP
jgi:hypothetical protein